MHNPGFFKRLVVISYDGLLLLAVCLFSSAILMALFLAVAPEPFYLDPSLLDAEKIATLSPLGRLVGNVLVTLNCLSVSFFFFGWFWTHGGQTLGMKAWKLYLIQPDGKFISWRGALIRYLVAIVSWLCMGLGFTWILLNKKKRAWHDIASNSQIIFQASVADRNTPSTKPLENAPNHHKTQ